MDNCKEKIDLGHYWDLSKTVSDPQSPLLNTAREILSRHSIKKNGDELATNKPFSSSLWPLLEAQSLMENILLFLGK